MSFDKKVLENKFKFEVKGKIFAEVYEECCNTLTRMKHQAEIGNPEFEEYVSVKKLDDNERKILINYIHLSEESDVRKHIILTETRDPNELIHSIGAGEKIILFKY